MEFNLKDYIQNKYVLNESIQSNIFINKLLNNKSNLFKYYKIEYKNTLFYNYKKLYSELLKLLDKVFRKNYLGGGRYKYTVDEGKCDYYNLDTPEKIIQFHNQYEQLYNKFKKLENNLFKKPEPQLLTAFLKYSTYSNRFSAYKETSIDIQNITDTNFVSYTYAEMKKNKQQIKKDIEQYLIFWFSENDEILAVSKENNIMLLNPMTELEHKYRTTDIDDILNNYYKYNKLEETPKIDLIDIGKELEFNVPDYNLYDFVQKFNISESSFGKPYSHKVGAFYTKSSNIYKETGWGNSNNDYILIYVPQSIYISPDYKYVSKYNKVNTYPGGNYIEGYNDLKNSERNNVVQQHKKDVEELKEKQYKWVKDILGKYLPYGNKEKEDIFAFGNKLEDYDYEKLYGNDKYCSKLAYANYLKYKSIIQENKAINKIKDVENDIIPIVSKIKTYIGNNKILSDNIKLVYRKDVDKFKELILLYGVYTKTLNVAMDQYSKIILRIKDINLYKTNNKNKILSDDEYSKKQYINTIQQGISRLNILIDELKNNILTSIDEINNKINDELEII